MQSGDFYESEQSTTISHKTHAKIVHKDLNGNETVLKKDIALEEGEIIDAAFMSKDTLQSFLEQEIEDSSEKNILFSLHLKATMMKVSDPIIFGHAVKVFFKDVFSKYEQQFMELGVDPNNGVGDVYSKIENLPDSEREAIEVDLLRCYENRPEMAMVDSDRGITNLHVPSDVIIDASMPAALRTLAKCGDLTVIYAT